MYADVFSGRPMRRQKFGMRWSERMGSKAGNACMQIIIESSSKLHAAAGQLSHYSPATEEKT